MQEEFLSTDHLQDEMLRVLLKRFIILCTRKAEDRQGAVRENSLQFETIRKFYVLVDTYFKEKKQVQEYADMLNKSPKTLANILSAYQQPSAMYTVEIAVEHQSIAFAFDAQKLQMMQMGKRNELFLLQNNMLMIDIQLHFAGIHPYKFIQRFVFQKIRVFMERIG